MILAQITPDPSTAEALSVWSLAMKGGLIMIPIAISSLVAVYIFFGHGGLRKIYQSGIRFFDYDDFGWGLHTTDARLVGR